MSERGGLKEDKEWRTGGWFLQEVDRQLFVFGVNKREMQLPFENKRETYNLWTKPTYI